MFYRICLLVLLLFLDSSVFAKNSLSSAQLQVIGERAYIYAFPLVLMDVTKQVTTNVAAPVTQSSKIAAPVNQFANAATFPNSEFKDIVRPNADTLYSSAWLDISKEPIVLSVPNTQGHYYLIQILDAWTNVFASLGKRTTGTEAQNFVVVGPDWKGTLPANVKEIKAPTNMVWLLGRVQTNGKADFSNVNKIQKEFKLTPLSAWGQLYTPLTNVPTDPAIKTTPPIQQVKNMNAATFFKIFTDALKLNPPAKADGTVLDQIKKIGIEPGKNFDISQYTPEQVQALNQAVKTAQQEIAETADHMGKNVNGWKFLNAGTYGTEYETRAAVALMGLGANIPQDAIYPTAFVDADGKPLNGQNRYIIHFNKNELPPVNAFWSISMYDPQSFFVANSLKRYAIGDRDKLQFNSDGSLDIYIQNESPGFGKKSNWLPAPTGDFNLTMRLYWPKESALNGTWTPPTVKKVS